MENSNRTIIENRSTSPSLPTHEQQASNAPVLMLPDSFFNNPVRIGEDATLADELFQTKVVVGEQQLADTSSQPTEIQSNNNQASEQLAVTDTAVASTENNVVQGEVIDDNETIAKIREIIAHPQDFQRADVERAILNALAGRSYTQFLAQETNKDLIQAVEDLKAVMESAMGRNTQNSLRTAEALGLPAPQEEMELKAEDIDAIEQVTADNGEKTLEITKKGKFGPEKISIGFAAAAAMFLVADFAFFKGSNMEAIGQRFGAEGAKYLLLRLGFDVKLSNTIDGESMEKIIGLMEPYKLQRYIEESNERETVKLLEGVSLETRQAMLSGKDFGGLRGNAHKLDDNTIALIFSRLTKDDMERLEVTKLNPSNKQASTDSTSEQATST